MEEDPDAKAPDPDRPKAFLWLGDDYKEQEYEGARAFAKALNTQDISHLARLLTDRSILESQHVMTPMVGKKDIVDLWTIKLANMAKNGPGWVKVELAHLLQNGQPCLIVEQGGTKVCVVLFKMERGMIARIDICGIMPRPEEAEGTGEFPGLSVPE